MTDKLQAIEDAFFDIPFENSAFQNEAFVVASQITPERAYRAIGLRITAKLRALNEALFAKKKLDIDLAELKEKAADESLTKFERMRAEVEIEEKRSHEWFTRKLIRDAEVEVDTLYRAFQSLPKFTREQFELGERKHFTERLLRQRQGITGANESLMNLEGDLAALAAGTLGQSNLAVSTALGLLDGKTL